LNGLLGKDIWFRCREARDIKVGSELKFRDSKMVMLDLRRMPCFGARTGMFPRVAQIQKMGVARVTVFSLPLFAPSFLCSDVTSDELRRACHFCTGFGLIVRCGSIV